MKRTEIICDRCQKQISTRDERVTEFLAAQYPDKDICQNCDIDIELAGIVASKAALLLEKPEEYLRRWFNREGIREH